MIYQSLGKTIKVLISLMFRPELIKLKDGRERGANPGVPCSKLIGGFRVNSAFHLFEVSQMSNMNFWKLSAKK